MAETKRRTPAIPDRPERPVPGPQFFYVPGPPEAPANAVIAFRYGRDVLAGPEAFVTPRFLPFPYWQEPPATPANPVLGFRYGRDVLEGPSAFVPPHYLPFPYFEQPASSLIPVRYGRDVLWVPEALVSPRYLPFPYAGEAPASPSVPFRYGRPVSEGEASFVLAHYFGFPYFQEAVAAANPVIAFLRGQWLGDAVPFPESVVARYFPFPYFEQPPPALANPVIPILARRLSELHEMQRHPVPQYYGYVESNEEIASTLGDVIVATADGLTPARRAAILLRKRAAEGLTPGRMTDKL